MYYTIEELREEIINKNIIVESFAMSPTYRLEKYKHYKIGDKINCYSNFGWGKGNRSLDLKSMERGEVGNIVDIYLAHGRTVYYGNPSENKISGVNIEIGFVVVVESGDYLVKRVVHSEDVEKLIPRKTPIHWEDIPKSWYDRCSGDGHLKFKDESGVNRYQDTGKTLEEEGCRPCAKCGQFPNDKGDDDCMQNLGSVVNACCGHGAHEGYIMFDDGRIFRGLFTEDKGESWEEQIEEFKEKIKTYEDLILKTQEKIKKFR